MLSANFAFADSNIGNCNETSQKEQTPVCDYTGKCVYTEKVISYECTKTETNTTYSGGHEETVNGNTKYFAPDYIVSKDFSNSFSNAMAGAGMVDASMRIWSGWEGKCEHGTFTDFSWLSNPMFLAQTALHMIQLGNAGMLGTTVQDGLKTAKEGFDVVADAAKEAADKLKDQLVNGAGGIGESGVSGVVADSFAKLSTGSPLQQAAQGIANGTGTGFGASAMSEFIDKAQEVNQIIGGGNFVNVTYTNLAFGAVDLAAAIDGKAQQQAVANTMAHTGNGSSNVMAQAYKNCMMSLGLSFANQIGWSAGADSSITGVQIQKPWQNPLRMSDTNLGMLATIVGQKFFEMSYMVKASDPDIIGSYTVIALNSTAYTQAGQIICGGYQTAAATNIINNRASQKNKDNSAAIVNSVISSAINMLPPPYNLAGSIAFKVLTSFSQGNACTDLELAMSQGATQYKTNQFINQHPTPCVHRGDECAAKFIWGDCMRTREKYCCYDQITTRIFAETAYAELGLSFSNGCSQLRLDNIKDISFAMCQAGQTPQNNHCMAQSSYDEFKQALYIQMSNGVPVDNLVQSIRNSLSGGGY
jgi:hypothetical protein